MNKIIDIFKNFRYSLRCFRRRLYLSWFILKKDRDWDQMYMYKMLYMKFSNMVDYFEKDGVADMVSDIDKIKYCRDICKHLADCETYPERININNAKRVFCDKRQYAGWMWSYKNDNEKPFSDWKIDLLKDYKFSNKRLSEEELYDEKAKYVLFELMKTYIGNWWD